MEKLQGGVQRPWRINSFITGPATPTVFYSSITIFAGTMYVHSPSVINQTRKIFYLFICSKYTPL